MYIYIQYNPVRELETYVEKEIRVDKTEYILIGIGLCYHLDYLVEKSPNVQALNNHPIANEVQNIVPQSYVQAVENDDNPVLHQFSQDIKIRPATYKKREKQLIKNFGYNISYFKSFNNPHIVMKKSAALVSAGPSLNDTVSFLQSKVQELDIYCVGSALRFLLKHDIVPKAVVITDPLDEILKQIPVDFTVDIYFLSTANYRAVQQHQGGK